MTWCTTLRGCCTGVVRVLHRHCAGVAWALPGVPWRLGFGALAPRPWRLGIVVPWRPISLVPWRLSSLVSWCLGSLVPCFLHALAPRPLFLGALACHGSLAHWYPGTLAPWHPGSLVP